MVDRSKGTGTPFGVPTRPAVKRSRARSAWAREKPLTCEGERLLRLCLPGDQARARTVPEPAAAGKCYSVDSNLRLLRLRASQKRLECTRAPEAEFGQRNFASSSRPPGAPQQRTATRPHPARRPPRHARPRQPQGHSRPYPLVPIQPNPPARGRDPAAPATLIGLKVFIFGLLSARRHWGALARATGGVREKPDFSNCPPKSAARPRHC